VVLHPGLVLGYVSYSFEVVFFRFYQNLRFREILYYLFRKAPFRRFLLSPPEGGEEEPLRDVSTPSSSLWILAGLLFMDQRRKVPSLSSPPPTLFVVLAASFPRKVSLCGGYFLSIEEVFYLFCEENLWRRFGIGTISTLFCVRAFVCPWGHSLQKSFTRKASQSHSYSSSLPVGVPV
jgi:hypothetical protein